MPVPAQSRAFPRVLAVFLVLLVVVAPAVVAGVAPASALSLIPGEDVTTASGTVRGNVDLDHREFDGIPFAAPPTGKLRWRPPQPVTPWSGERAATSKGPSCPQAVPKVGIALPGSSEDCLTLDVETPPVAQSKHLPVMVWFYGGAYELGATSQYDPTPLVTKGGVIVVAVNYRVGPLGFLALPGLAAESAHGSAGNYGLLDQLAGLTWVRQNIAAFGGDPKNVTIFGESAGGNSVCQQLASPLSAGLFQRAIVQSGGCGGTELGSISTSTAYARGQAYAQAVGCSSPVPATELACLRGTSFDDLLKPPAAQFTSMAITFVPDVDGWVEPHSLGTAFSTGAYHHVPVLIGGQHDEGRLFVALFYHLLTGGRPSAADYASDVRAVFGSAAPAILAEYPASRFGSTDLAEAQVWTDGLFACTGLRAARGLGGLGTGHGTPLYAYEFTDPAPPLTNLDPLMPLGDFHGSDLFYLFAQALEIPVVYLTPAQQQLSTQMTSYWTTFARTGNPNSATTPTWPAWSPSAPKVQDLTSIGSAPVPATTFSTDHDCGFWGSLP